MPVAELHFVEAYRARNPAQAHVIGLALEEEGHRVLIENEWDAGYPPGWGSDPRLMVEESHLAVASKIIGQIDHGPKSKFGSTVAATYGLFLLYLAAGIILPQITLVCFSLALTVGLPLAYARIRFGQTMNQGSTTCCLTCQATMSETETACPSCGWTYGSGLPPESP